MEIQPLQNCNNHLNSCHHTAPNPRPHCSTPPAHHLFYHSWKKIEILKKIACSNLIQMVSTRAKFLCYHSFKESETSFIFFLTWAVIDFNFFNYRKTITKGRISQNLKHESEKKTNNFFFTYIVTKIHQNHPQTQFFL